MTAGDETSLEAVARYISACVTDPFEVPRKGPFELARVEGGVWHG